MTALSFDILLGQEKAKTVLERIFVSGRMAHAYLFRGPDGIGKKGCAGLVAARLNCHQPTTTGGCGECSSCKKYLSGNHPDIVFLSPENGIIKIDQVRALCRSLSYPPYESSLRVVILEDVHSMRVEAANSLLKTLEEPPEKNLLILTAESSKAVLPTIQSRCQTINFYPLSYEQTARVIMKNHSEIGEKEAYLLSELAGGSPGIALTIDKKELVPLYHALIGVLTEAKTDRQTSAILQAAEKVAALKEDLPLLFGLLRIWLRELMVAGSGIENEQRQRLRLEALAGAERQLARNCNRTLVCEVLLFNLQSPMPRVR